MKLNQLVICDSVADYAEKLADYLRRNNACGYEISTYTNATELLEQETQYKIGLLLIEDSIYLELLSDNKFEKLTAQRIILLTKDKQAYMGKEEEAIYKYQSGYGILCRLLEGGETLPSLDRMKPGQKVAKVIGVYSPIKRTLKTAFAITLGQLLAEREEVLYINLEGCSGLARLLFLRTEKNLMDLAYEFSSNGQLPAPLHSYIQIIEKLSMIPPAEALSELQCIKEEEWLSLLGTIAKESGYQSLLLDIGDNVCGIMEL